MVHEHSWRSVGSNLCSVGITDRQTVGHVIRIHALKVILLIDSSLLGPDVVFCLLRHSHTSHICHPSMLDLLVISSTLQSLFPPFRQYPDRFYCLGYGVNPARGFLFLVKSCNAYMVIGGEAFQRCSISSFHVTIALWNLQWMRKEQLFQAIKYCSSRTGYCNP